MTAAALATALHAIATTDDVRGLSALAGTLRRDHPGDAEAETVARTAERKRRRLAQDA
jgi:hypothetical protein